MTSDPDSKPSSHSALPLQSEDGVPHLAYYDKETLLSFIWDGHSDEIQICKGGYGEPVWDTISLDGAEDPGPMPIASWVYWFGATCKKYVEVYKELS